ncbi:MAG: DUF1343 domain-containing protein [Myxococcota bacterium]|nr:DUF1343 domain-containing protein [Myxococcota bacterium]
MKHTIQTGLDRLIETECAELRGRRVAVLCHAASVGSDYRHITQVLRDYCVNVVRCFGPEHGIWADAQDMIAVTESPRERITGAPVRSLYGTDEASLAPAASDFDGVDVLLIDLQDVGARYYTYIYTAALSIAVAGQCGVESIVLDRPNPISGHQIEGRMTGDDFLSFVGMWPLPTRHGLTIGEVSKLLNARENFQAHVSVVEMRGWRRSMYFDETALPWVQPSPNMPTLDTAIVYPGMCLLEGTTMSEGRGTTRPFELVGAPYIDPFELAQELNELSLPGIAFRPVYYQPTFHKHASESIGGIATHVFDRAQFQPLRMGLHFLAAVRRLYGHHLEWRTEAYEFVTDRLAIDLLFGCVEARQEIDGLASIAQLDQLWRSWQDESHAFAEARKPFLIYPE